MSCSWLVDTRLSCKANGGGTRWMVRAFSPLGKGSRAKSGRLLARLPPVAPLRSPHQPVRVRLRHCPVVGVSTNLMHITREYVDIRTYSKRRILARRCY